jgi:putative membrane protein
MALLSESDKAKVRAAIEQVERRTRGEFITVIAKASDDYFYIPSLWAALIALLIPAGVLTIGTWMEPWSIYAMQLLVFVVLLTLFRIPAIKIRLVPKTIRRLRASRVAREQFFIQGLQNTEERTGILLFVSIAEQYVEVIADKGINDVVPEGTWDNIVNNFLSYVKKSQYAEGFITTIENCGGILAEHFPGQTDDKNELPDHLIEL